MFVSLKSNLSSFFKTHKKIIFFSLITLAILFIPAFAAFEKDLEKVCKGMAETIFSGGLTDSVNNIILADPRTAYPSAWSIMVNVYNSAILPIAYALIALHLVVAIVQTSIRFDQLTTQQLIKPFVVTLACIVILRNGLTILEGLIGIGQGIVETMSVTGETSMANLLDEANALIETQVEGIFTGIGVLVQLFLPWAAAAILSVAIRIVCYTRIFELYLKTMLAPFGMADLPSKGLEGNSLRFFKNYFATCLQGAVIIAVSVIYGSVLGSLIPGAASGETSILGLAGTALVLGFAALSMMMKAGSVAKEVIGA